MSNHIRKSNIAILMWVINVINFWKEVNTLGKFKFVLFCFVLVLGFLVSFPRIHFLIAHL